MYLTDRRGMSFFAVLSLLSAVVLICAGIMLMVLRDVYDARQMKYGMQAFCLAEAGAEKTIKEMKSSFSYVPPGTAVSLGEGSYTVTVTTATGNANLKLITSTGTVKGVSKTVRVQLYNRGITAFDYSALGSGKIRIGGGASAANPTIIIDQTGAAVKVHSNDKASSGAVEVGVKSGGGSGYGRVAGDVTACGSISIESSVPKGVVTGSALNDQPSVEMPPFDDNFFQYYYNLALADNNVKSGNQTFTSDPCAGKTNKVVYVTGNVDLVGTWTMTGCIVATGYIYLNKTNDHSAKTITINQQGDLPAILAKHGNVEVRDPAVIHGMVYANGWIILGARNAGTITTYGVLHSKNYVNLDTQCAVYYERPNPPGISQSGTSVDILNWSAD